MNESQYRVLRLIAANPELTQREIASELGVSLGKANYCLNALIEKGWVKARNFRNNQNKLGYAYLLTPKGIQTKSVVAVDFLRRKMDEYEELKREIELLQSEAAVKAEVE